MIAPSNVKEEEATVIIPTGARQLETYFDSHWPTIQVTVIEIPTIASPKLLVAPITKSLHPKSNEKPRLNEADVHKFVQTCPSQD